MMKSANFRLVLKSVINIAGNMLIATACLISVNNAEAHLTYTGRDLGVFSGQTNAVTSITNQTVTGNYGWADAADGILGDSHRGRAFRFRLDNPALITLAVSANANATPTSLDGFNPAFSIYSGLAAVAPFPPSQTANPSSADHDFGSASAAWRTWWVQQNLDPLATDESATDGSWNALGDWKIGGDGDLPGDFSQLSSFSYKYSAIALNGSNSVTGSLALPAGDYTIMIGGNEIANKTSGTALSGFGISVTLSVSPGPVLTIAPKVFVSWSGLATNLVVQSAPSVDATNWMTLTNTMVILDGQRGVVLDGSSTQQYFRLNYVP